MNVPNPPQKPLGWVALASLISGVGIPMLLLAFWVGGMSIRQDQTQELAAENTKAITNLLKITERHDEGQMTLKERVKTLEDRQYNYRPPGPH